MKHPVPCTLHQNARTHQALQFMVVEEVILAAAGAFGALHAAYKKDRNTHRHKYGEEASIRCKPMKQAMHT